MKIHKRTFILYAGSAEELDEAADEIHDAAGNILAWGDVGPAVFISSGAQELDSEQDPDWDDEYAEALALESDQQ